MTVPRPAAEMRKLFEDLPEACDNTLVIAQRCAYMPAPRKPILPSYTKLEGRSEGEALRARILALEEEQRASAVLIQSLAEQNAQGVRAVDALRVRSQRLLAAVCVLAVATAGLLAWAAVQ